MQQSYQDDVGQPDAPAIHHSSVGVYFAVSHPHIHPTTVGDQAETNFISSAPFLESVSPSCLLSSPNPRTSIGNVKELTPLHTKEKLKTWGAEI